MRIHLKCSCGAEAEFCDDRSIHGDASRVFGGPEFKPDAQGRLYHVEVVADRWHMDHAKCREAWREDAEDRRLASEVLNDPKETYTKFDPAKECEHDWHRELVGPDPSGESVAVDTCRKCQRKEVGRDLA